MTQSKVGEASVYEAGDQRNEKTSEFRKQENEQRFEEGKENSHQALDSKDERSIANKLAAATSKEENDGLTFEQKLQKEDPTLPALYKGKEPSKKAKQDKEIMDEEAEILAKKDAQGKH